MPTVIYLDQAIFKWQLQHGQRMTFEELAKRAGITRQSLNRLKNGDTIAPDLDKINAICKVLECKPGDILIRQDTHNVSDNRVLEAVESIEMEQMLQKHKLELQQKMERAYVKHYKGWIVKIAYSDKPDIILLRPGASSQNPSSDDIVHLEGHLAEEWHRQNPNGFI
jgi:putative transcriptional regulator